MKQARKILRRDFKRIAGNGAALVVLLGIALLPSLYAWFNIAANKDPYGNLTQEKIAVSNEDTSVPFQGEDLNAGDKVIEQLKKKDWLGWTFVDKEEAIDGVKAGRYYAAIVIPSDFSASILSFLDEGELRLPALDYYVNEKLNAIAPKITSTGLGTLESEIDSRFVAMSSEILGKKSPKAERISARGREKTETEPWIVWKMWLEIWKTTKPFCETWTKRWEIWAP